jgi:hypothetical protein
MTENEAREIVCEYGKRLARSGLVVGTWGNLSVRADTDLMVITPSGADYERLTRPTWSRLISGPAKPRLRIPPKEIRREEVPLEESPRARRASTRRST